MHCIICADASVERAYEMTSDLTNEEFGEDWSEHPILGGLICSDCAEVYGDGNEGWSLSDGSYDFCRWYVVRAFCVHVHVCVCALCLLWCALVCFGVLWCVMVCDGL